MIDLLRPWKQGIQLARLTSYQRIRSNDDGPGLGLTHKLLILLLTISRVLVVAVGSTDHRMNFILVHNAAK